ncbi:leishmanolysin family protein, putative [Ichthyophthirius multifiliis]|uniref:Leishmanolysin family protein, putative n=1 Tax=Ichthyophthirius multifiliis TaxID=5932 RepID=G0QQG2_ICHMU|nr:leishmanolysin family protein, putative [Ichthyophthirius multifiliis]EGR32543.1 leishmanolysin family protein, putative [Ichthyophthirius multifiliis]|eukprot:XP_004036529.1 leishmanolysin family protein, putative [Ichthyophthirius multifiliis]
MSNHDQRILQTGTKPQPIRITTDYSMLNQEGVTEKQKKYIIDIMESSKLYFQRLLKVYPLIENNIFPRKFSLKCLNVQIPNDALITGIPNSDLHLYVICTNEDNDSIANAGYCAIGDVLTRPIFGRVNFNLKNINQFGGDAASFENDLETSIHEILHVLGFSSNAARFWINPDTGKSYGTTFKTKLQKTNIYRGKKTGNDDGSFVYHFEKTVIYNEMMTSDESSDSVLSIFTIALLKDTGFYPEVNENMADNIFWGKGKGCDFLENACQSTVQYPEYSKQKSQTQCTFEYDGIGIVNSQFYTDNCGVVQPYSNRLCTNPNSVTDITKKELENDKLSNYSTQSKCFQSTAQKLNSVNSESQFRCHQYKCSSDASEISVIFPDIDLKVLCEKGEQNIQKDIDPSGQKARGKLTCPQDYDRFCNYTSICPNFCSEKGVCVNGQCICKSGFGGVDCSINCSGVVDNETCIQGTCPQSKFLNPDNTCKSDCPLVHSEVLTNVNRVIAVVLDAQTISY